MTGDERREQLMELLQSSSSPVTGTRLAAHFHVSRQIIVQDVALLRAGSRQIVATPRGYFIP